MCLEQLDHIVTLLFLCRSQWSFAPLRPTSHAQANPRLKSRTHGRNGEGSLTNLEDCCPAGSLSSIANGLPDGMENR